MDYLLQDTSNCSVGRTVDIVGRSWVLLILREIVRGVHRFSDIQDHLGVSRSVLADRLEGLVADGVLQRRDYRVDGQRPRSEYRLTRKGWDLYPIFTALRDWGDRYLADPAGPALLVTHAGCGAPVHAVVMCEAGHAVHRGAVEGRLGPSSRLRSVDGLAIRYAEMGGAQR
jgi:DNA-binding HxlR family transcriptional regulator